MQDETRVSMTKCKTSCNKEKAIQAVKSYILLVIFYEVLEFYFPFETIYDPLTLNNIFFLVS